MQVAGQSPGGLPQLHTLAVSIEHRPDGADLRWALSPLLAISSKRLMAAERIAIDLSTVARTSGASTSHDR